LKRPFLLDQELAKMWVHICQYSWLLHLSKADEPQSQRKMCEEYWDHAGISISISDGGSQLSPKFAGISLLSLNQESTNITLHGPASGSPPPVREQPSHQPPQPLTASALSLVLSPDMRQSKSICSCSCYSGFCLLS
jgi:hypothetical protein